MVTSEQSQGFGHQKIDNEAYEQFKLHCNAPKVATNFVVLDFLRKCHSDKHVTRTFASSCNLLAFAGAGHAKAELVVGPDSYQASRMYQEPSSRLDDGPGSLKDHVSFGQYQYEWANKSFLVYLVRWDEPMRGTVEIHCIVSAQSEENRVSGHCASADSLILAAAKWTADLHDEIYVFDSGTWVKNKELWDSVQQASWGEVILDQTMKDSLIEDVQGFFDCKELYQEFGVPWKRGVILHGLPGNGKTISLKALMHSLSTRPEPIPSLYVKSFKACQGEEYSIRAIFRHARNQAPCLLIFEDLDSLVHDKLRSYFLNEVDGLESNDGILMIGSTNHLERLDPAISKRPSRFDRKYHYKLPGHDERAAYSEFWRRKLAKNPNVDFPPEVSPALATLTEGFSFAYLNELFVTALLIIVRGKARKEDLEVGEEEEVTEDGKTVQTNKETRDEAKSQVVDSSDNAAVNRNDEQLTEEVANKLETEAFEPEKWEVPPELRSNLLIKVLQRQVKTLRDEMDNSSEEIGAGSKVPATSSGGRGRRVRMLRAM